MSASSALRFISQSREKSVAISAWKGLEDWLPIIEVARDLVIAVEGGILVELLKSYLWHDEVTAPQSSNSRNPTMLS